MREFTVQPVETSVYNRLPEENRAGCQGPSFHEHPGGHEQGSDESWKKLGKSDMLRISGKGVGQSN